MTPVGRICSPMVLYAPVQFPMIRYGPVRSSLVPYVSLSSCMVLYGPVCSIIVYCPVWSCMVVYGPLWSPLVLYGLWNLSSPIALLSPKRYQILADIESFAFFFLLMLKVSGAHAIALQWARFVKVYCSQKLCWIGRSHKAFRNVVRIKYINC